MDITTLLSPDRIACETDVSSKKRAFEILAGMLAQGQSSLGAEAIFDALTNREKLGSTAVGNGVALPHACMTLSVPCGALLLLDEGIKMDTPDKKPVHILMGLLVPSGESSTYAHLMTDLTTLLVQKNLREQICNFQNHQFMLDYFSAMFARMGSPSTQSLAA
jgi:PTS system nitrogen regulatory IIA component